MSKTLRSRIAAVVAAAVGAVVLSAAPAFAAPGAGDLAVTSSAGVVSAPTLADGSDAAATAVVLPTAQLSFGMTKGTGSTNLVVSSNAVILSATGGTPTVSADQTTATNASTSADTTVVVRPISAAGTTFTVKSYNGSVASANLVDAITFTVADAAKVGVVDPAKSYINFVTSANTNVTATGTDDTGASIADNGSKLFLNYSLNDAYGLAVSTAVVIATVGSDSVVAANAQNTTTAGTVSVATRTGSTGTIVVSQAKANAPAAPSISVSVNGTAWSTKTGKIRGDLATITLTVDTKSLTVGASNTDAISYTAADSAGNALALAKTSLSTSSTLKTGVMADATISGGTNSATTTAAGNITVDATNVLNGTGTLAVKATNAAGTVVTSNAVTLTAGSATVKTYTVTFDKATYAPGDIATLTISALDSKGVTVADTATIGTGNTAKWAVPGLTAVVTPADTNNFTGGTKSYKYTVGQTTGTYSAIVLVGSGLDPVTVKYTVATPAAAPVADPSIVALTTAVQSMMTAIQVMMTSLSTSITKLLAALTPKKK